MSAIAMNLYDRLRESGMADDAARGIAEIFDAQVKEALRDAKKHADQAADKVRAEAVPADEYHRRMENTPTRAENESQFEKLREDIGDLRNEFRGETQDIRNEFRSETQDIRREMRDGFAALRREMLESRRLSYGILLAIFLLLLKDIIGL